MSVSFPTRRVPQARASSPTPDVETITPATRWQKLHLGPATCTTRASSSPPTSTQVEPQSSLQSARRSLGLELEDLEVYDMASSDADMATNCVKTPLTAHSVHDRTAPKKQCDSAVSLSCSPCTPLKPLPDAIQDDSDTQPDVWSVEDWSSTNHFSPAQFWADEQFSSRTDHFSPVSSGCNTSPCGGAQILDESQRAVADAILAELNVDLDSAMQRAIGQMSSWVSQEIVFARKALEDDIHKVAEQALETKALQTQCLNVGEETVTPRSSAKRASGKRSSTHVIEARMAAEERRWRMKLDGIEATLSTHADNIDTLGKHFTLFSTKSAAHDADTRENSHIIQRIEAQLKAAAEKDRYDTKATFDTHLEMVGSLRQRCSDIETQLETCNSSSAPRHIEARLSAGEAERLALKAQLEKRCDSLDALVEKGRLDSRTSVESHFEMIESLRKRCSDIEGQVAGCDVADALRNMDAQRAAEECERHALKETISQCCGKVDALGQQSCLLAEQVTQHTTNLESSARVSEDLEVRLSDAEVQAALGEQASNLATNLSEQVALHTTAMQRSAQLIEALEIKLNATETAQLDARDLAAEQIQELSGAIEAQIYALEEMQQQILTGEKGTATSLAELRQESNAQLKSKVDSKLFSSTLKTIDEVARRIMHKSETTEQEIQKHTAELKSLAEELNCKSSNTDLEGVRHHLKAWVDSACETTAKTTTRLAELNDQVQISSEVQNDILKRVTKHEIYFTDLA